MVSTVCKAATSAMLEKKFLTAADAGLAGECDEHES